MVSMLVLTAVVLVAGCSRKSVADRLKNADRQMAAGDYASAEIELLNALRLEPKNSAVVARLGVLSQQQGHWNKALAFLNRARLMDTNNVDVRRSLALAFVSVRQHQHARDEAEFVLRRVPGDDDALFALVDSARTPAEIQAARRRLTGLQQQVGDKASIRVGLADLSMREKDVKSAEAHLRQAVAIEPRSGIAHAAMATVYFVQGDRTNATRSLQAAAEMSPPRSNVRLKWADYLIELGRVDEARASLEQVMKDAPGYLPPMTRLAQLALDQRRYEDCAAMLRRALTAESVSFDALLLNGKLQLARQQPDKAVREFERLAGLYPKIPVVHYQLALAQLVAGDQARGLASLSQAVELDPGFAEAVLLLSEVQLRRGDVFAAINSITSLLKKRPQHAGAHFALAEAYRVRGTPEDAVKVYQQLMEISPRDPQVPFLMGVTLRQQKKLPEARQAFERSLVIEPAFLRAVMQVVELDIEAKNGPAALARAQQYAARYAQRAEPQWLLAQVYLAQPDNARAEQALQKAIELDPGFSPGYVALARLLSGSGRQKQAVERLDALLERDPKDAGALLLLAIVHEQSDDLSAAEKAYERLLAVNPRHAAALNNAACLFAYRLGKLDRGLELARRARELSPFDPLVADTLGWILHLRGSYAPALALFQESARQLPAEPEVLFHLGMTHYMMGEDTPALAFLERSLQTKNATFAARADVEQAIAVLKVDASGANPAPQAALEKRLADHPKDPVAASRLAAIQARQGHPDRAIKTCEQALKANPDVVRLLVQLAGLYSVHRKDPARALEYARDARKLAPEDSGVAAELGRIAFDSRDHKWAYSLLQDAARNRPTDGETVAVAAWAAYSIGRTAEADTLMSRALQVGLSPASSNAARRFVAMTALTRDPARIPAAVAQLQSALAATPDDVPTLMAVGLAHQLRKNSDDARKAYERALALYPEFTPAMKPLAGIYAEQGGNDTRAQELASKVRETTPGDVENNRTIGILAYRRGELAPATRMLKEVTAQRPTDATAFYYLGMAHARSKEVVDGQRALRRALELDGNASFAADARKTLAELK